MEYTKIPNVFTRETFGQNRLIEGSWSTPELEFLKDNDWVWTEKVDGTNIRVVWDGYRVSFAGRTDKATIPTHLAEKLDVLFGGPEKEELFEAAFGETPAILFGEGYGEKIQKGGGLYGPVNFILFDVFCGSMWLRRDSVEDIAFKLGIQTVPVVGHGTLSDGVEYIRSHPVSKLRDAEMEGIVCRPSVELSDRRGNRVIVKIKCRDFPWVNKT